MNGRAVWVKISEGVEWELGQVVDESRDFLLVVTRRRTRDSDGEPVRTARSPIPVKHRDARELNGDFLYGGRDKSPMEVPPQGAA